MHIKRFLEWIGFKEKLHSIIHKPPFVSEREIWWASLGENIGAEINGKSNKFSRPVIILKKVANGFYLVIPVTSQVHEGTWYVNFKQNSLPIKICPSHFWEGSQENPESDFIVPKSVFWSTCLLTFFFS